MPMKKVFKPIKKFGKYIKRQSGWDALSMRIDRGQRFMEDDLEFFQRKGYKLVKPKRVKKL